MIQQDLKDLVELGTKLEEIAFKCDVTRTTVERWLNGTSTPHRFIQDKITRWAERRRTT